MSVKAAEFRRLLGHWATGVSVVTAQPPAEAPCGLTVNAFCSLSLEPPLVLVCIEKGADSHDCIERAGKFCVNVLAAEQERLARRFAGVDSASKFDGIAFHRERTGAPVLAAALAWIECEVRARHDGGDHTIFIGEVIAGDARQGAPIIYYRGGYGRCTP